MSYYSPKSNRNKPPNNRQIIVVIGMFVAAVIGIIWLISLLFNLAIAHIPYSVEAQLGKIVNPAYEKVAKPSPTQKTLNQLLDRLETHLPSEQADIDYQVLYVPESTINALALPGNTIIIYQGLLEAVESENELMMVLGHELGHFHNRDHLRKLGSALFLRIAISYVFGDSSWLYSFGGNIINAVANAQFSQNQEQQADRFGLELLYKTYGQVSGATDFFARLQAQNEGSISFLATHPAPEARVKRLDKLIEQRDYPLGELKPLPASLSKFS
jgi:predicted Zn-dependent protease